MLALFRLLSLILLILDHFKFFLVIVLIDGIASFVEIVDLFEPWLARTKSKARNLNLQIRILLFFVHLLVNIIIIYLI